MHSAIYGAVARNQKGPIERSDIRGKATGGDGGQKLYMLQTMPGFGSPCDDGLRFFSACRSYLALW